MSDRDTRTGVYQGNAIGWYLFLNQGMLAFFFGSAAGFDKTDSSIKRSTRGILKLPEEYFL